MHESSITRPTYGRYQSIVGSHVWLLSLYYVQVWDFEENEHLIEIELTYPFWFHS